jgi:predicted Fe-Mo cluster-binding NifX family protein
MKVAIPVDDQHLETMVCMSFGRAPYFMFYDTDSKEHSFLENSAADSPGGAGIKAAQAIVDQHVDALLTPRCGENAAEVIKSADIKLYKTEPQSAMGNIDAFVAGKLSPLSDIHPGFHNRKGR